MGSDFVERRDSPRVPFEFMVREKSLGGSFEARSGNLSIGGVYFSGSHPPVGSEVEVRFVLPGNDQEIEAAGEVIRVRRTLDQFGSHIRFTEISVEGELAVARYLQAIGAGT
jgi:uncharacterized protein (TIGR02266 family)